MLDKINSYEIDLYLCQRFLLPSEAFDVYKKKIFHKVKPLFIPLKNDEFNSFNKKPLNSSNNSASNKSEISLFDFSLFDFDSMEDFEFPKDFDKYFY